MKFMPVYKFKEQVIALAILVAGGLVTAGFIYEVFPDTVRIAIVAMFVALLAIVIVWPLIIVLGLLLMELGKALSIAGEFLYNVFVGNYKNWKLLRYYRELYMDGFEAYVRKQNPLLSRDIDWEV